MRIPYLLTLCLIGTASALHAQTMDPDKGFTCLANNPVELQRHLDSTPNALERALQAKARLEALTQGFTRPAGARSQYLIPVVVHIIHDNGPENISDAQVYDAIRILNEDFNKQNPDWPTVRPEFLDLVGDVGIEFRLARKDPQGNCTNGITRTLSSQTYVGDFDMTQLIQWPRERYMNVWVCVNPMGAAGYTYYPEWLDSWPEADGMVMRHDYMGSIGTSVPSRSRIWGHEVGHWLNLKHCWGDSNEPGDESNCFMDDDVDDTPLTKGWTSCFLSGSSCGSAVDNVQNYMEYSYCAKMFTQGQADRMLAALNSPIAQRDRLWQPATLEAAGLEEVTGLCLARFSHGATEVCQGTTVQFRDESFHNVQSRTWSFPGGEPATSNEQQPTVHYGTPGTYPVSLTVSDGTTTQEVFSPALVRVFANPGGDVPFSEGFEDFASMDGTEWVLRNPDLDNTFEVTGLAAFTGQKSLRLTNGSSMNGLKDELVSTTLDMRDAGSIRISYRYAYAQRNSGNDDRLRVYVSRDCGATWSLRQQLRGGTTLSTVSPLNGDFIPGSGEDWGFAEVNNISSAFNSAHFRVRFEFESNGGNNLYLDDINVNGLPVGISEKPSPWYGGIVAPNPAHGQAQVLFELAHAGRVRSEVRDAMGRMVRVGKMLELPPGTHRIDIPIAGLASGPYVLMLDVDGDQQAIRFMVE
jgi:hypothetical protein